MALLNVRLRPDDERMAVALRDAGVQISTLVRDALRAEYERRIGKTEAKTRPSRIVQAILESLPDHESTSRRVFSLEDRHAVQRHIRASIRRKKA